MVHDRGLGAIVKLDRSSLMDHLGLHFGGAEEERARTTRSTVERLGCPR